ncbi:MAG: hypothetical protein ACP5CD_00935 [Thermovirgaceae bacterium]
MNKIRRLYNKRITGNFGIIFLVIFYFLLTLYMESYHIDDPETSGWILYAYFAAYTLLPPFVGWIVERISF